MNKLNSISNSIFPAYGVFLISLCFLTLSFNIDEFIAFQSRFGLFAQEMLRNGISFFPTTYGGEPYPDYPAGSVFIIWLFSVFSGGLTPFVAVLPTMITSSLILMFVYKIGAFHSQRLGFIAVAMTLLAIGFWQEARTIALDQYISLITIVTFYLLYRQKFLGKQTVWWVWLLLWSVAFVIRGPIGIVVPCAVACSFYLLELRWRELIITGLIGLGLIIGWWYLLLEAGSLQGGQPFLDNIKNMQVSSRVNGFSIGNLLSYFWRSFGNYALLYPLCVALIVFAYKTWWNKNTDPILQLMRFSLIWALVIICGFSLATGKKSHYLLAMIPALGLFASCAWVTTFPNENLDRIRTIFNKIFYYLPLLLGVALLVFWLYQRIFPISRFPQTLPSSYFFACLFLLTLFWVSRYFKHADKSLYIAVLTIGIIYIYVMEPVELYINRAADFVQKLEESRQQDNAELAFYKIYRDGLAIKYMVQLDNVDAEEPLLPSFFDDWTQVTNSQNPLWVIIERDVWEDELSLQQKQDCQEVIEGKIGRADVIVCKTLPKQ